MAQAKMNLGISIEPLASVSGVVEMARQWRAEFQSPRGTQARITLSKDFSREHHSNIVNHSQIQIMQIVLRPSA